MRKIILWTEPTASACPPRSYPLPWGDRIKLALSKVEGVRGCGIKNLNK